MGARGEDLLVGEGVVNESALRLDPQTLVRPRNIASSLNVGLA